ncbi:DUF6768 family protein [Allopontixanthobacter sp.]|uniref:DUF6768 family protein n=1 Tax=Allopontixanthobacter sp. TaxID=2906452 RepID=UPI002ABC6052|nr:DUF6768 family protein [Allopontixanthobacter sp.]MDZ4308078.1 DUF6768 family protein [Allopontixanthobacter sp.]
MRDPDLLIDEALDAEERELLRSMGEESGFLTQSLAVLQGPTGWVKVVIMIAQAVMFLAGVWTAWHFFNAVEPVQQLRWGLPSAVLLIVSIIMKMALIPSLEANRLMRELKRIELQLARSSGSS